MRFKNELDYILAQAQGHIVYIDRPVTVVGIVGHDSEKELEPPEATFIVDNSGKLEELREQVKLFAKYVVESSTRSNT